MRVTGYAYPWDVLEPGFAERVAGLGVDEVAIAVAYHSARAATPWSRARTSVVARHAALYRPVREAAWRNRRLRPAAPDWAPPDSAGEAVRIAHEAGVPVAAWLVLTHNSLLGTAHPDVTVRNCFGESYPWALCPAREEVREYVATLAAESLAGLDVSSVILEACGQLGVQHQHQHEKTDAVWSPAAQRILSVCCCAACAAGWGEDPARVRAVLADEARRLVGEGDVSPTADALPADLRDVLLAKRHRHTDALRTAVLDAIGPGPRIILHGATDPWATGALPGLTAHAARDVDAVVLPCWQPGEATLRTVRTARDLLPSTVDVGAYVTAVAPTPLPDGYVAELAEAGTTELHLYHLGLAGPARWRELRNAATTAHAAKPTSRK